MDYLTRAKQKNKLFSLYFLAIFCLLFPILEGYSNSVIPVGTVGIGFLVISIWFFETLITRQMRLTTASGFLFLFVCWMALSIVWSVNQIYSALEFTKYIMVLLFYIIVNDVIRDEKGFLLIIKCYLFGVFIIALSGLRNILTGETYNETSNRYSADGFDPNNFGIILASSVPLIIIAFNARTVLQRLLSILLIFFFVLLVISSASRAATISVFLSLFGIISIYYGFKKIFQILLLIGGLLFVISFGLLDIIPQESIERLSGGIEEDGGGGRSDIWKDAISMGIDKFWTGYGIAMSYPIMGNQSHNTFVSAFFEGGVISFILWILFWLKHFQFIFQTRLKNKKDVFSLMLFFSLISLLVGALTLNWEFRKSLYLIFGLVSAWYNISNNVSNNIKVVK